MLLGIVEPDKGLSYVVIVSLLELVLLHELGGDLGRLTLHDDLSHIEPDRDIRHLVDGIGPVRCEDHTDVVLPDVLHKPLVDEGRGVGVEGTGGLVRKEEQGLLSELPCHDDPLLLSSGEVTSDVGGPVSHVDELEELDRLLELVTVLGSIRHGLEDVLEDGGVSEESKRPLKHDGYAHVE